MENGITNGDRLDVMNVKIVRPISYKTQLRNEIVKY